MPCGRGCANRDVYVSDLAGEKVAVLSADVASGALTPAGSVPTPGGGLSGIALTPDGKYLYQADYAAAQIRGYRGRGGRVADPAARARRSPPRRPWA